jgi:hypothetical protein
MRDQFGNAVAAPWPAPNFVQTLLIDINNDDARIKLGGLDSDAQVIKENIEALNCIAGNDVDCLQAGNQQDNKAQYRATMNGQQFAQMASTFLLFYAAKLTMPPCIRFCVST